jgi:hypothetical protein
MNFRISDTFLHGAEDMLGVSLRLIFVAHGKDLAHHELQRKHGDIERELDQAMPYPSVDDLEIATLKRRKLALERGIEKLKASTKHKSIPGASGSVPPQPASLRRRLRSWLIAVHSHIPAAARRSLQKS